jgi:hypothetical protein
VPPNVCRKEKPLPFSRKKILVPIGVDRYSIFDGEPIVFPFEPAGQAVGSPETHKEENDTVIVVIILSLSYY